MTVRLRESVESKIFWGVGRGVRRCVCVCVCVEAFSQSSYIEGSVKERKGEKGRP